MPSAKGDPPQQMSGKISNARLLLVQKTATLVLALAAAKDAV